MPLIEQLDSFDAPQRQKALAQLIDSGLDSIERSDNINMHFHSFFSYNSQNWSPTRIAWQSHKAGLYAAGLCDFDVLDGQQEFLAAGEILGLRTTVNLETRGFLTEYADKEITSPGEPGVTYLMGAGFARNFADDSSQAEGLRFYRQKARQRNTDLIERINPHISKIAIDYQNDVLPLTPTNSATERHIIIAYINKSLNTFDSDTELTEFWSKVLGVDDTKIAKLLKDRPAMETVVRAKFVKQGGIGYIQPSSDTFPTVEKFFSWVRSCDAIAMITWLDGTSNGEANGRAMLECMQAKGAAALNIIPDRNWNISNTEVRNIKQKKLHEIIQIANDMHLPVNIGTEMNKLGQPFVDDLDYKALRPFKDTFLRGARILVGHSILLRFAGFSYTSQATETQFGQNIQAKNNFFESVGRLPPLTRKIGDSLRDTGEQKAYAHICDSAKNGNWIIE